MSLGDSKNVTIDVHIKINLSMNNKHQTDLNILYFVISSSYVTSKNGQKATLVIQFIVIWRQVSNSNLLHDLNSLHVGSMVEAVLEVIPKMIDEREIIATS